MKRLSPSERAMLRDADAEINAQEQARQRTPNVTRVRDAVYDLLQVERDQKRRHVLDMLDNNLSALNAKGADIDAREVPGWLDVLSNGPLACECKAPYRCWWHKEAEQDRLGAEWRIA